MNQESNDTMKQGVTFAGARNFSGVTYDDDDTEIDILSILWKCLAAWKPAFIFGVVFALCAGSIMYGLKLHEYNKEMEAYTEDVNTEENKEAVEKARKLLSAEEERNINNALVYEKALISKIYYYRNSYLMKIDTSNKKIYRLKYLVTADADDISAILDSYQSQTTTNAFVEAVGEVIDKDAKDRYIRELINAYYSMGNGSISSEKNSGIFSIDIIVPTGIKLEDDVLKKAVNDQMAKYSDYIRDQIADFTIKGIRAEALTTTDSDLQSTQTNTWADIISSRNSLKNLSDQMKDEEALVFKYEAKQMKGASETNIFDKPAPFDFSKKFVVLFFVVGVFLYAAVIIFIPILRGSTEFSGSEALSRYGNDFGIISAHGKKSRLQNFLCDPRVIHMRDRKLGSTESQIEKTAKEISRFAAFRNADSVAFVLRSKPSESDRTVLNSLLEQINREGRAHAEIIEAANAEDESLSDTARILAVLTGSTKNRDIQSELSYTLKYNLNLLGSLTVSTL